MSTGDSEEDLTPDLESEDDEDNDNLSLSQILQKISDCNRKRIYLFEKSKPSFVSVCFLPKEHGMDKLREWLMKSEPRAREQFQSLSSTTTMLDQSTLVDSTFSRVNDDSMMTINEGTQMVEDRLASRVSIVFSREFLEEFPSSAQIYFNEGGRDE